ncbi:staphopain-like protein [Saccharolobus shibatae B12]|uniref:Uncharacterized protein E-178 n=2 Tax=root TaxID=1 RepID=E178_SSV1|nr:staphopain [Saccharolobus shibatae]NP_039782.1 staphopain [Sulfolobus spindle-shaped virus 1]P20216.1 RecName: Full=Uncharacterized protein E-178 [Sulfolobus spindle-shaped virus 1]QXJ30279.1 staphopain-like protein [Saccharolobus shibatae B12]CAA30215.1 ORF E-178 [Sulfolobus spindle-shaped virus 1]
MDQRRVEDIAQIGAYSLPYDIVNIVYGAIVIYRASQEGKDPLAYASNKQGFKEAVKKLIKLGVIEKTTPYSLKKEYEEQVEKFDEIINYEDYERARYELYKLSEKADNLFTSSLVLYASVFLSLSELKPEILKIINEYIDQQTKVDYGKWIVIGIATASVLFAIASVLIHILAHVSIW